MTEVYQQVSHYAAYPRLRQVGELRFGAVFETLVTQKTGFIVDPEQVKEEVRDQGDWLLGADDALVCFEAGELRAVRKSLTVRETGERV